jgi:hypothetical protein
MVCVEEPILCLFRLALIGLVYDAAFCRFNGPTGTLSLPFRKVFPANRHLIACRTNEAMS